MEREVLPNEEENFWSKWLREDQRGKEERMGKAERNEEERGEKRKRECETEESKRGLFKEDVRVVFQRKPFKFLVKGEIWSVVVIFLGKTLWRSLRTGLIVNLICVRVCVWCLM